FSSMKKSCVGVRKIPERAESKGPVMSELVYKRKNVILRTTKEDEGSPFLIGRDSSVVLLPQNDKPGSE
ncbi:MAG: hypothetical protein JSU58_09865, partial [Dehalococcoidales bacterium]